MEGINSKKLLGTILGVAMLIVVVVGATYAWFTWTSPTNVISGTSSCFDIYYTKGNNIGSEGAPSSLLPSATYSGGLSTEIKVNLKTGCVAGTVTFKLTTTALAAAADKTVDWTTTPALHFAVMKNGATITNGTGNITAAGTIDIGSDTLVEAASATTTYTVYVWLDGAVVDDNYVGATYAGYVHASATQTAA
ncbi:MAG: hypothetical protein Q4G04_04300 [bacterium]|nr:hypothetical protein [bacterium]